MAGPTPNKRWSTQSKLNRLFRDALPSNGKLGVFVVGSLLLLIVCLFVSTLQVLWIDIMASNFEHLWDSWVYEHVGLCIHIHCLCFYLGFYFLSLLFCYTSIWLILIFLFYFFSFDACLFIMKDKKDVVSNKMRELTREEPYSNYILWKKIYFQQKKEEKKINQKLFILNEFGIT